MYSLPESTLTLTADLIQIPAQLQAYTEFKFDPGSKRKLVPGYRESPLYVARGSAEPKLSIKFSSAQDYRNAWQSCGGASIGGATCTLACALLSLASLQFEDWRFTGIILPAPGFTLNDSGYATDIDLTPTDAEFFGVSIYPAA